MGVKERQEREKSETRDNILDAARELFLSEGYDGVSMRKVAEKIEYSPTAIYLHFTDKEQLFHELVHEDFARLATVFQSAAMPANPVERIREIGRTYVEFWNALSQSLQAHVHDAASARRAQRPRS